jgi:hypothetical protein
LQSVSRSSVRRGRRRSVTRITRSCGRSTGIIWRGPYYGSRRMAAWLATQRQVVNRKRVRRLMWLMGLRRSIISGRIQPQQQRHPRVYPRMATVRGRLGLRVRPATGLAAPRPNRPQCRRRVLQRATGFIRCESRDLPGG